MPKRLTMKEIARLSGVSRGTVDRILHNRGRVSESARQKVEAVLEDKSYKNNLHISAVPFKKTLHLAVCLPDYKKSGFWKQILDGISKAVEEYSDIDIELKLLDFHPFEGSSQLEKVEEAISCGMDAIIIAPVFAKESPEICHLMDQRKIPYVFVNTTFEGANPVAAVTIDQYASGKIAAKLADGLIKVDGGICVCYAGRNRGDIRSIDANARLSGVKDYFSSGSKTMLTFDLDIQHPGKIRERLLSTLEGHPEIKGIIVTNAWGNAVTEAVKGTSFASLPIVSYDLTEENRILLEQGKISAIIGQRPVSQGYLATEIILRQIMYNSAFTTRTELMPIDIIFKDNLPYYKDKE